MGKFDEGVVRGKSDEGVAQVNQVTADPKENTFRRNPDSSPTGGNPEVLRAPQEGRDSSPRTRT